MTALRSLHRPGVVLVVASVLAACGDAASPPPTSLATTASSPITSRPTSMLDQAPDDTSRAGERSTTTTSPPGPPPRSVAIPVGPQGISYRAGAEDLEALGPGLIAVTEDGAAHIFDPVDGRLVRATADDVQFIDLFALDVYSVTALAADGLELILVEVFFGPERHRIHRIDATGAISSSVDLPIGFRLEDGLSGVLSDDDGDVILEFGGGDTYGRYDAASGTFDRDSSAVIRGVEVIPAAPDVLIDGILITADLVGDFGGLRYLATDDGGRHVVERVDVLDMNPLRVLRTVEWYSATGEILGSARVPAIDEQAIDVAPGIAVDGRGHVVALLALQEQVVVLPLDPAPGRITD